MKTVSRLALVVVLTGLSLGCLRQKTDLVVASEVQPLKTYQNASPAFCLTPFIHAPGNLLFQVENLLPDFSLSGLPEITSSTGRIVKARLLGEEGIEFNLLLPGDAYLRSRNDVRIPWVLVEKGPGGFLRSEGEIVLDVAASAEAKYFIQAVTYRRVSD